METRQKEIEYDTSHNGNDKTYNQWAQGKSPKPWVYYYGLCSECKGKDRSGLS